MTDAASGLRPVLKGTAFMRPDYARMLHSADRWCYIGGNIIDLISRDVQRDGRHRRLTRTELRLLLALMDRQGAPVSREQLLNTIWGAESDGLHSRAVDVNIGRLRRKLEDDPTRPRLILTVAGYGYVLQEA